MRENISMGEFKSHGLFRIFTESYKCHINKFVFLICTLLFVNFTDKSANAMNTSVKDL